MDKRQVSMRQVEAWQRKSSQFQGPLQGRARRFIRSLAGIGSAQIGIERRIERRIDGALFKDIDPFF